MGSFTQIVLASLATMQVVLAGTPKSCPNPTLSCPAPGSGVDSCCVNTPGGQLVQTQFWDTSPSTGPSNSWTIHGLWPDHCDGTYDSSCDPSRAYTNIGSILQQFGKSDVLSYMKTYWVDINGNDETFWEHEWAKHGTCISTLNPSCYTGYTTGEEAADFFQRTVDLFKTLDSYNALANAGIVPSTTATYTASAIQNALQAAFGYQVTIQCKSGALDEIWYSFDVLGSVQTGTFQPAAPVGQSSSCSSTGIKYLPKSGGVVVSSSVRPTTTARSTTSTLKTTTRAGTTLTTTSAAPSSTPTGVTGTFSGSGYLNAITSGSQDGCLISYGTWYTSGTCATYTATASGSGFTLKSSKGSCGISSSNTFTCGSGVSSAVFTAVNGFLAYNGATDFYTSDVPTGQTQATVETISDSVTVNFQWQSK